MNTSSVSNGLIEGENSAPPPPGPRDSQRPGEALETRETPYINDAQAMAMYVQ
jgi:hypothetical protein